MWNRIRACASPLFWQLVRFWLWVIFYTIVLCIVITVSFWTYSAFYYFYIPVVVHSEPVYFAHKRNSLPAALVPMTRESSFLRGGLEYSIDLVLELPESPVNTNHGVFMINAVLVCGTGSPVAEIDRPALMRYKSWLIVHLQRLLFIVPLMFGLAEERQVLSVPLADHFVDSDECPITAVRLELSSRIVQIYSAEITFRARFSGLRYLMYHWFKTTYVIAVIVLSGWQIVFLICARIAVAVWCCQEAPPDPMLVADEIIPVNATERYDGVPVAPTVRFADTALVHEGDSAGDLGVSETDVR